MSTWFKAWGSDGVDISGAESPDILNEDMDDFAAPRAFYSNQGALLGRVKFDGVVELEDLIEQLNDRLQFFGEEREDFDFRAVYARWDYKYQVIATRGPTDEIVVQKRQRSRRR